MNTTAALIKDQFYACRRLLTAIGDEFRQIIITVLSETERLGLRVGDITEQIHLSRPAVSHHLKILLDAEVVGMYKEATKHYDYLKLGGEWKTLVALVGNIERFCKNCILEEKL